MPNIIECASCHRRLNVPEELAGQLVQCPTCARTFIADIAETPDRPGLHEAALPERAALAEPDAAALGQLDVAENEERVLTLPVRDLPPPPKPLRPVPVESSRTAGAAPVRLGTCPSCGAALPSGATRCPWCEADDEAEERPWERPETAWVRRDCEPHRGTLILVLGILSLVTVGIYFFSPVGLGLGIAAWAMGQRDLAKIRQKIMDPQGKGLTQAGWICGIIGTVLNTLWVIGCGGFFLVMITM